MEWVFTLTFTHSWLLTSFLGASGADTKSVLTFEQVEKFGNKKPRRLMATNNTNHASI